MYNLIEMQNKLKGLSKEQLMQVLKSGSVPQYMVVSELNRRKNMESDQARREATDGANTVTQEVINAVGVPQGGIVQLASAMNAQTDNTQNTGVRQMADGGVVKMQTAGKPPSIMSNIMSLMSPPSYDVAGFSKPRVAREPEMTALEALETIPPDAARALEISKKIQVGKNVKKVLKEVGLTALEAANLVAGAGAYLSLDTGYKTLNAIGTLFDDDEARVIFDMAQSIKDKQTDALFKKHGNWLQRNLPRLNPNFAYTFEDREKVAEQLSTEELEAIRKRSEAAIAKADTYDAFGDRPASFASLFAEGTPVEFLKGTPKNVPKTLPFGPKDSFDPFGDPVRSRFTKGFPRNLDLVGNPMTDNSNKLLLSQNTDAVNVPPVSSESAVRSSVAEEISRLGGPAQTNVSQPPAINPEGDSDDTLFANVVRADQPFKLGGKALEEAEAKKAAEIKKLLASEATELPFLYGPEEMSMRTGPKARPMIREGDAYTPDLNNELAMIKAGLTPKTDLEALNFGDRFLGSKRSFDEFGNPKIVNESPFTVNELIAGKPIRQLPDYGDAMADLSGRAADYFRDARLGDLNQSPEEVYGDPSLAYLPSSVRDYFAQTIENQQKAMPGGGGRSGLGALFAQTIENQKKAMPGGTDPNAKPTLQSRFDRAKLYLKGIGQDMSGMTQEDVIEFAKKAGAKGLDLLDTGTTIVADKINEFQERKSDQQKDRATGKFDAPEASEPALSEELVKLRDQQQALFNKQLQQVGKSDAALSEYLSGLERDREFDKAMALANAGAALMMPSATFGEGLGKAVKAGTKTLQKGKDSYNKNKLQVLALQGRIDAAKSAAANRAAIAGGTVSSRILLAQRDEKAKQLNILAPFGAEPDAANADAVKKLTKEIADIDRQLDALTITTALGGIGAGNNDIAASYNLVG